MKLKREAPKKSSKVSAARNAAFEILLKVAGEKTKNLAHSDDLLRSRVVEKLPLADRHLVTTLVLGVLRWQLVLDAEIRKCLKRPNGKLDSEVLIALRLGAFQLLYLDRIPAHAALNESVELVREAGHPFAVAMTNAVLRKIQANDAQKNQERELMAQAIAAHPAWMVERWTDFYGREAAEAICLHGQKQPRLAIRLAAQSVAEEAELRPSEILTAARIVESGEIIFSEGGVRIQDEGSQLVGEIAAALIPDGLEEGSVLDCCAAPGGKTMILAERLTRARIFANDASAARLENLRERVEKLPREMRDRIDCRQADAAEKLDREFDLILADVPCSGTGTLGRNPEIRHRLTVDAIARQAERQRVILKNALSALKIGGRLVYSTCSLEPEENGEVVHAVLDEMGAAGKFLCNDGTRNHGRPGRSIAAAYGCDGHINEGGFAGFDSR